MQTVPACLSPLEKRSIGRGRKSIYADYVKMVGNPESQSYRQKCYFCSLLIRMFIEKYSFIYKSMLYPYTCATMKPII